MIKKLYQNIYLKNVLIAMVLLKSIPVNAIGKVGTGLDPSWVYALNLFVNEKILWGSNVVFTYGPLGFLVNGQNVNANLLIVFVFWILILFVHFVLLYQLFYKTNINNGFQIIFSTVLFLLSGYLTPEYYLSYLALLALLLAWKKQKQNIWISMTLLVILFYIKTSSFLTVLSALLMYMLLSWIFKLENRKSFTTIIIGGVIMCPVSFLAVYNHSFNGLTQYIYGSMQVAMGYNVGMAISAPEDIYIIWAVVIMASYFIWCGICFKFNSDNFILAAVFLGPLFFLYKHGFVRMHISFAFKGVLWVLSLITCLFEWKMVFKINRTAIKKIFLVAISIMVVIPMAYLGIDTSMFNNVFIFPKKINEILEQDLETLNVLPDNILNIIGEDTVSIYPLEISYLASNKLNYLPMPVMQLYSAYTPYLDNLTSNFYSDIDAPEYVIFSLLTIDSRWTLIECPKTWKTISVNYEIVQYEDGIFVLKKKDNIIETTSQLCKSELIDISENIDIPEDAGYAVLDVRLNTLGKIAKLFWKIPEVYMEVKYVDGSSFTRRVILDNFQNGADFNSIVYDEKTFVDYMNFNGNLSRVESVSFSGKGLKFYEKEIITDFYVSQKETEEIDLPSFPLYSSKRDLPKYETIEMNFPHSIDEEKTNQYYTKISGWAFADETIDNTDIYIECDGMYYETTNNKREDVERKYKLSNPYVGFSVLLDHEVKEYNILIVDNLNSLIYKLKAEE